LTMHSINATLPKIRIDASAYDESILDKLERKGDSTVNDTAKFVLSVLAGLVLVVAIIFGGWAMGWWFKQQDVGLQRDVNRNSQQYQDGLVSQERDRVQAYDVAVDDSQKKQISLTFCAVYQDLVKPPTDIMQAQARICLK
jgi:hypothetical protein